MERTYGHAAGKKSCTDCWSPRPALVGRALNWDLSGRARVEHAVTMVEILNCQGRPNPQAEPSREESSVRRRSRNPAGRASESSPATASPSQVYRQRRWGRDMARRKLPARRCLVSDVAWPRDKTRTTRSRVVASSGRGAFHHRSNCGSFRQDELRVF